MNKRSQRIKQKKKLRQIARRKKKLCRNSQIVIKQEEVFKPRMDAEDNKFNINMFKSKPIQDDCNKGTIINKGFDKNMWGMSNDKKA